MKTRTIFTVVVFSLGIAACSGGSSGGSSNDKKKMYVEFDQGLQYSDVGYSDSPNVTVNELCKEVYNFSNNQVIMKDDDKNPLIEIIDGELFVTPNPEQSAVKEADFGECPDELIGDNDLRCYRLNWYNQTDDIIFLKSEQTNYDSAEDACEIGVEGSLEAVKSE